MNQPTSNRDPGSRSDDLLTPSLQSYGATAAATREPPWRLRSQIWVAFFGGVLPYAVIAYMNGQRLGLPANRLRQILWLGAVGFVATVAVTYLLTSGGFLPEVRTTTTVRLGSRAVALLAFLAGYRLQKSADRIYQFDGTEAYASLWKMGLIVTLGLGFVQNIVVYALVALLARS